MRVRHHEDREEHKDDNAKLIKALQDPLKRIVAQPDLLSLGVKRQGNHIDNSKYLYYDGQLVISLDEFPKGKRIPPHDHGVWEALAVYKGSFDHTVYERKDDGTKEGYADLAVVDDRRLQPGDVAIVAQPAEIHTFVALEEGTYSVTVVGGHYPKLGTTSNRKKRPAWSASRKSSPDRSARPSLRSAVLPRSLV